MASPTFRGAIDVRGLVIGASGLVGGALLRALGPEGSGTYRRRALPGLRRVDARYPAGVVAALREFRPDVLFFPAADANVDTCEMDPNAARVANVEPALVALACARDAGVPFVFFSSDYVFDGAAGPYAEDAPTAPLSVYGRHKREVEARVLAEGGTVIRTTTVFGDEPPPGRNFVLRLVANLRAGQRVAVPSDQVSTPTWADALAEACVALGPAGGVWHVAGPELLARDELARRVAAAFELDRSLIESVPTSALHQRAPRPLQGGLRTDKIRGRLVRPLAGTDEALASLRHQLAA